MSRYSKKIDGDTIVAYGFDHVLGYFIDVFKEADTDEDEDPMIVELCSTFGASNEDILKVMEEFEVNPEHCKMLALDLPF